MHVWNSEDTVIEATRRRPLFNASSCQLKDKYWICFHLSWSRWYDSERLEMC